MNEGQETQIIVSAQQGDMAAFEMLVQRYERQVMQLAYQMVSHAQDAEDIYQEVFLKVYDKLHRFQFRSEFSTWLYRITVNSCIDFRNRNARRRQFSTGWQDSEDGWDGLLSVQADARSPEEELLNQELAANIESAVQQLSDKLRAVFILRHYHGKKLREIAEIMDCALGTVKNYLFRATQKMQDQLRTYR